MRDLPPTKDPKGGSPKGAPQPQSHKPKSDQLRHATIGEYLKAHSHPNGDSNERGWHGFIKSNLFVALLIFLLGQAVILGSSYFLNYVRTSKLWEWKVSTDLTLKRMDDWGTTHGHFADERQDAWIAELQGKTKAVSDIQLQISQLVTLQSERNNQQDKEIGNIQSQIAQISPTLAEIKTKLAVVADLLDERTKNKR